MKTRLQSLVLAVVFSMTAHAQELQPGKCGTVAPGVEWEQWFQERIKVYKEKQAQSKTEQAVVTIPVIVHILHNKKAVGSGENISAGQVQAQIDLMNDCFSGNAVGNSSLPSAFANVDANDIAIRFCLALRDKNGNTLPEPGIDRVDVSTKSWGDPSSGSVISDYSSLQGYFNNKAKPATIWDPTKYFNIWIANFISNSGNYLGFATFPPSSTLNGIPGGVDQGTSSTDGVVMGTGVFGNKAKYPNGFYYSDNGYIYGITSLHEVGHYLGLRHISGDAACGNDYCNDTPPQKGGNAGAQNGLNWRCPSHPFQANSCSGNPNGEMFQNFMDYSDDGCRSLFTADQETRMLTAMQNSPNRKLLGTHGLCTNSAPAVSAFSADKTSGCSSLTVQFTDESTGNPTSWLWNFGDGNTSTQQNPIHTYASSGKYNVKLSTSNQYGGDTATKNQYIIIDPGTPFAVQKTGPVDNTFGGGGNFNTNDTRGLLFDVTDTLVIETVKVYATGAGDRTIQVLTGVGGTIVHTKTVSIPNGESRVALGFTMMPGNQYFMKVTGATVDLYRNNAGASFPYSVSGLVSITQTDYAATNPNYYYYFYDWEVRRYGCNSNTTGIGESSAGEVRIYPNPSNGIFRVELPSKPSAIEIVNVLGENVLFTHPGSSTEINISDRGKGVYFLKVYEGEGFVIRKLIIE